MKRIICLTLVLTLLSAIHASCQESRNEDEKSSVYAFGVCSSLIDSAIVVTEIQQLDCRLNKAGFMPNEQSYSKQLTRHITGGQQFSDKFSTIFYETSLKKIKKERSKLLNKYKKKRKEYAVKTLSKDEFLFKEVQEEQY